MNGDKNELELDFTSEELGKISTLSFKAYIELTTHLGKRIEAQTGIGYLVPIIQSAHESRSGNSGLARNHCNLFGIMATSKWKIEGGKIAPMPTYEYIKGVKTPMVREFRKYDSWADSFADWAKIITGLKIYARAWELMKKPETLYEGMAEMGRVYATDPKYAVKLIELYKSATL